MRLRVRVPGKLMLVGEYAVTQEGHPGIVMAVDRYLICTVKSHSQYILELSSPCPALITASTLASILEKVSRHPSLTLVYNSLRLLRTYLEERGRTLAPFHATLRSDLQTPSGIKMGMGSSAAVSIAMIAALTGLEQIALSPSELFKLGSLPHLMTQPDSSCIDVAAATYGGVIYYERFNGHWVSKQLEQGIALHELINQPWPGLHIHTLLGQPALHLVAGWSGQAAYTPDFLHGMYTWQHNQPFLFRQFLERSDEIVNAFARAWTRPSSARLIRAIHRARRVLQFVGNQSHLIIETEAMVKALDAVKFLGGAGKTSGAGGGDMITAWLKNREDIARLRQQWLKYNIMPISLRLSEHGVQQDSLLSQE